MTSHSLHWFFLPTRLAGIQLWSSHHSSWEGIEICHNQCPSNINQHAKKGNVTRRKRNESILFTTWHFWRGMTQSLRSSWPLWSSLSSWSSWSSDQVIKDPRSRSGMLSKGWLTSRSDDELGVAKSLCLLYKEIQRQAEYLHETLFGASEE